MSRTRPLPLSTHGPIEAGLGLLVLVVPLLAGFGAAATVLSVLLGALGAGLGFAAAAPERATRVAAHEGHDYGLAFAYAAAALAVGLGGDGPAAVWLALAGIAQLGLNLATRYAS